MKKEIIAFTISLVISITTMVVLILSGCSEFLIGWFCGCTFMISRNVMLDI